MAITFENHTHHSASACSWLASCCRLLACCGDGDRHVVAQRNQRRSAGSATVPEPQALFVFQSAGGVIVYYNNSLLIISSAQSFRHPLKLHKSPNCDAFLNKANILGIADGVNSVADEGIDPTRLPREVLSRCFEMTNRRRLNELSFESETSQMFQQLRLPYKHEEFMKNIVCRIAAELENLGSSTLCVAAIQSRVLHVANIGDSGLLQFRLTTAIIGDKSPEVHERTSYQLVGRTKPTCHGFNNPYQITRMPDPDIPGPSRMLKDTYLLSESQIFDLQDGDVIILATDGLLDNLYPKEIVNILDKLCLSTVALSSRGSSRVPLIRPERVAKFLVDLAVSRASPSFPPHDTPFSDAWYELSGRRVLGGKPDDTTAIVAYVEALVLHDNTSESLVVGNALPAGSLIVARSPQPVVTDNLDVSKHNSPDVPEHDSPNKSPGRDTITKNRPTSKRKDVLVIDSCRYRPSLQDTVSGISPVIDSCRDYIRSKLDKKPLCAAASASILQTRQRTLSTESSTTCFSVSPQTSSSSQDEQETCLGWTCSSSGVETGGETCKTVQPPRGPRKGVMHVTSHQSPVQRQYSMNYHPILQRDRFKEDVFKRRQRHEGGFCGMVGCSERWSKVTSQQNKYIHSAPAPAPPADPLWVNILSRVGEYILSQLF